MAALNLPHDNIQDHTCKNHQNHEHLAVQAQIILMNWRLAQGLLWYKNVACCTHDSLRHTDVAQANKLNNSLHNVVLHVRGQRRIGKWNIANFFNGLFVPVGLGCSEILLFSHPVTIQKHVQHVASLPPWLAENQGDPKNVRYNNSFWPPTLHIAIIQVEGGGQTNITCTSRLHVTFV